MARRLEIINMMPKQRWDERDGDETFAEYQHSLNPCEKCLSKCCTKQVFISAYEAAVISRALSIPFSSFLVTLPWEDNDHFAHTGVMPYHALDLEQGQVSLQLRQREDTMCVFVFHVDGRGRCGNYAQRPGICRLYPYAFFEDGVHHWIGDTSLCAQRWLFDDDTPARVMRELDSWRDDMKRDEALCAEWNDAGGDERSLDDAGEFFVEQLA